jgi:uncharacterized protein (DUF2062 family)
VIRRYFRKKAVERGKLDAFLEKYHLPRAYFNINRKMITRGIGVGLFWGFIPMPFQMAGVMATTPFLRFNAPIALLTVWLSNPFTYGPLWYLEYITGNLILGREGLQGIELTMEWFKAHWDDIVVPLYVGTAFYSIVVSYLVYLLLNWLWVRSAHHEWHIIRRRQKPGNRPNNPPKEEPHAHP